LGREQPPAASSKKAIMCESRTVEKNKSSPYTRPLRKQETTAKENTPKIGRRKQTEGKNTHQPSIVQLLPLLACPSANMPMLYLLRVN
jgi:hypothetical protein